ncbi:hypothetical protein CENSYa_1144 [Cenarchaeum symbiosum A]|uniref:Uncharacterized protein n=1 Tax=Cenarchaeum symbiosum (strain A) TaxID=414004 RepID=A0RWQ4_CENSY|nr:hypothetical protein CENSYa_1144 [Cenarchaeum symbiosum A]
MQKYHTLEQTPTSFYLPLYTGGSAALVVVLVITRQAPRPHQLLLELVRLLVIEASPAVLVGGHHYHVLQLELHLVHVDPRAVAHARRAGAPLYI